MHYLGLSLIYKFINFITRRLLMRRTTKQTFGIGVLLVVLSLGVLGCVTVGREFSADAVSEIRIGETTREDVRRLFGEPWRTGIEDGKRTWTYAYYRHAWFGKTSTRDLILRFDENGVVVSYTFNTSEPEE